MSGSGQPDPDNAPAMAWLDPDGVVDGDYAYRRLAGPGRAAELDKLSLVPAVWSGAGGAELGHPAMSLATAADVDALLVTHGGFEILQTFTREFSGWLAELAWRAADAALRGAPPPPEGERLEDLQRSMLAMVSDLDVNAIIPRLAGPDDWSGTEPHWDDARYVTVAYLHAARKCFPDSPAGIMHRHVIVVGMIFGGSTDDDALSPAPRWALLGTEPGRNPPGH